MVTMRTRSQQPSPGGLLALDTQPKKSRRAKTPTTPSPTKKGYRDDEGDDDAAVFANKSTTGTAVDHFRPGSARRLGLHESKRRSHLLSQDVRNGIGAENGIRENNTSSREPPSPEQLQIEYPQFDHKIESTSTESPNSSAIQPATPSTMSGLRLFGSIGSLSRSLGRLFSGNTQAATLTAAPATGVPKNNVVIQTTFDTPGVHRYSTHQNSQSDTHHNTDGTQLQINGAAEADRSKKRSTDTRPDDDDTPIRSHKRFHAATEPRPGRGLFAKIADPANRASNVYPASATRTHARPNTYQQRNNPTKVKQHLWKLGWQGVPLNRLSDPLSVAAREREASDAGIDLAKYNFYEPGTEPVGYKRPSVEPENEDSAEEEIVTPTSKKRKRPPKLSPGKTIPNPPGVSYGMDVRYFDTEYDSDEEYPTETDGSESEGGLKAPKSALKKSTETSFERISRATKRVKFDNSPVDTPSKERARARYTGMHFSDAPNAFLAADQRAAAQEDDTNFTPTTHHPRPGTFCLPDDWSDESTASSGTERTQSSLPTSQPQTSGTHPGDLTELMNEDTSNFHQSFESSNMHNVQSTPEHQRTTDFFDDTTSRGKEISPLSKARQSAEKYKPKSPSNLRQAEHLASSSPLAPSTGNISFTGPEPLNEEERAAQEWARSLPWPECPSLVEAGHISQEIQDLLNALWTSEDDVRAREWFDRELEKFKAAEEREIERIQQEILAQDPTLEAL